MREVVIRAEGISKRYRIGLQRPYLTVRESLTRAFLTPFLRSGKALPANDDADLFWALRDISFGIRQGEAVGVIGPNGAGKSTLLKILSRITEPTSGVVDIHGRLSSLLEVGTGFHSELSGRENIYLNGAILGMRRAEIARKFDEIVAFAEVERFIDTPVKHYSTGMYMRLAFAVAAHLETELLVVDEVLAVGDAQFQKKCLGKMGEVARQGRTVLFVSHNMGAVQTLCQRALWLLQGRLVADDRTDRVLSDYLRSATTAQTERSWGSPSEAPGNDAVRVRRARVMPADGDPGDPITVETPTTVEVEYWNLEPDARLSLSLHVINEMGVTLFDTRPVKESVWHGRPLPRGLFRSVCHIPGNFLNDGTHRVHLHVTKNQRWVIFRLEDILSFEVSDSARTGWLGKWTGAVRPDLVWKTELIAEEPLQVEEGNR